MKKWKLRRTVQCAHCPWLKDAKASEIPNGYSIEKHKALANTIAKESEPMAPTRTMACHELHNAHCIGWLVNQAGPGNNIPLRIMLRDCTNADRVRLRGEQHKRFEDTIPKEPT